MTVERFCSGSEADSYLRLIDFVYHSTLGLRVIKKKKRRVQWISPSEPQGGRGREIDRWLERR